MKNDSIALQDQEEQPTTIMPQVEDVEKADEAKLIDEPIIPEKTENYLQASIRAQ